MTSEISRVGILGLGAWGRALALHCAGKGLDVTAWGRSAKAEPSLFVGERFFACPPTLSITSDLSQLAGIDLLIVSLPARAWSEVMPRVTAKTIVSATKGLEPSSGLTPLSYLREKLGHDDNSLCVVSGPSFAADLAAGRPLSLVSASQSLTTANAVASLFSGSTVRVYTSTDALGVEVGGIFKNVIAIAAGISDALELGPSARAGIISRGLAEMVRLSVAMGAEAQTLTGLSGLGDLIMTATENQSRNRTVGLRLGKGESIQEIIDSLGAIAEGVATAPLILSLAKKLSVDTPITEQISSLVSGDLSARQVASNLMNRPRKNEF